MSRCREFEEAFAEAAEGRPLSPEAEAHLRSCESCRGAARWLSVASQGFEALRSVEAPDPRAAVWARVTRPKRRPAFALAWATGVALCALASVLIFVHGPVVSTPPGEPAAVGSAHWQGPQTVEAAEPPAPGGTAGNRESGIGRNGRDSALRQVSPSHSGGRGRHQLRPHATMVARTVSQEKPAAETRVAEKPGENGTPAVAAGSCSETAALAYRAIGRALVMRFVTAGAGNGRESGIGDRESGTA